MSTLTRALPPGSVADPDLSYVIIGARYREQWIFVRHRERQSWELPAGHIETGEEPDVAAERELHEETGATDADLRVVSDYLVRDGSRLAYGRLYFADVRKLGELPDHEIGEIRLCRKLPQDLTYPEVQRALFSLLTLH